MSESQFVLLVVTMIFFFGFAAGFLIAKLTGKHRPRRLHVSPLAMREERKPGYKKTRRAF